MSNQVRPELLQRLLDEHGAALELFAAQWTEAPEDCVQEAFLQLVRQPLPPDRIVAWLFRVVRNRAISLQRAASTRRRQDLHEFGIDPGIGALDAADPHATSGGAA